MAGFSDHNIVALSRLLNPEDFASENEVESQDMLRATPASIVPTQPRKCPASPARITKPAATANIWDADEVPDSEQSDVADDPRPQPEYDIVYKQAISPEDVYLGMSNRDPSSNSCEDLVVKIQLPNVKVASVNLDVTDKLLHLRCPKFRLYLPLPHPCDGANGSAQWDAGKETLTVTLRMVREYDFLRA